MEKDIFDRNQFKQHLSTNPALQKALERKFYLDKANNTQESTGNK